MCTFWVPTSHTCISISHLLRAMLSKTFLIHVWQANNIHTIAKVAWWLSSTHRIELACVLSMLDIKPKGAPCKVARSVMPNDNPN